MAVRMALVDLVQRVAVVRVADDGKNELPHVLRGTLAALLAEPRWHVVVAFDDDNGDEPRPQAIGAVLDQARAWAAECDCRVSVTNARDVGHVAWGKVT